MTDLYPQSVTAIQRVLQYYLDKSEVTFLDDLRHYISKGFVISLPNLFVMAKIVDLGPEKGQAWYIRYVDGRLEDLLSLSKSFPLPRVAFRHHGRDKDYLI